ncbi:MAG: UDP-N-acetylmuramoyl-L-alanyl-D-glutamate--2,6-diaminopimelate ligase [Bacteroidetes bacterium HGW-Bacteroidetes-9]|nr:MAG: UDP-N-acetylmuramoyl-L-alanyl-D-glutamate--2,6-diaminopimelate ligase [Bacteroidetes bacterium HGW-Bacteroidetes-9]
MKALKDILYKCRINRVVGDTGIAVSSVVFDSRKTDSHCVFVAVKGTQTDGHQYINQVLKAGAKAIVCETIPAEMAEGICYVEVPDSSEALGIMASNFFDNPSAALSLVGITGTNGKTTTASLLHALFTELGFKAGLLSTVKNLVNQKVIQAIHTTPDAVELNRLLREMADDGCDYCFMEVSSHAVVQNRIAGLTFKGGVFTNLTHDHLDFHKTFDSYLAAKKRFFDTLPAGAFALVNIDDRNGKVMVQNSKAKVKTLALKNQADFHCRIIENHFDGLLLNINGHEVWCRLVGTFNAYNLLSIYATAVMLEIEDEECLTALSKLKAVEGRFEYLKSSDGIVGIVDYAHTPDALLNVIETINAIRLGEGKLITVVGAGGDRDKTKRPIMAAIASENSNLSILTSDNPRSENPEDILNDMRKGVPVDRVRFCLVISDRKEAIKTACTMAQTGDIVLVAGKGHETYQEIKGVKHHFDDREVLRSCFGIEQSETGK